MSDEPAGSGSSGAVGTRWPELIVAGLLLALGVLVVTDSLRVGTGWADDGPRAGYFPFYIGCLLILSSGSIVVRTLLAWRKDDPEFADTAQLASVMAVFVPMIVYVFGIAWLGIYVASALLIGYFMRRHGRFGWGATVGTAIGVTLVLFLVFERWFLVPLPKGPLEALFGY